jgi:hypothetical protein
MRLANSEAVLAVAQDVLADAEWTARVVVAAVVAQHELTQDRAESARDVLDNALV